MPRPSKLTTAQRERIREVAAARDAIPSNKELAFELGIAEDTVARLMTEFRQLSVVSRETLASEYRAT